MTDSGLTNVKNTNILSVRSGSMGRDARKNNFKKAAEEHKVCTMSIDDARSRQQIKHIGIGKTSKGMNNIPSTTSAFKRIHPSTSEGREVSPMIKERGHQEAIKMAAEVRDWNKRGKSYPKTINIDQNEFRTQFNRRQETEMKKGIGTIPERSKETRKTDRVNGSQDER